MNLHNFFDPHSPLYLTNLVNLTISSLEDDDLYNAWKFINRAGQIKLNAEVLFLKGLVIQKMGYHKESLYFFDQALKKQPQHKKALQAYLRLANHLVKGSNSITLYRAKELLLLSRFDNQANLNLALQTIILSKKEQYIGAVWKDNDKLVGWAINLFDKNQAVEIRYQIDGKTKTIAANHSSQQLFKAGWGNGRNAFYINLSKINANLHLYMPCGNPIPGSPLKISNTPNKHNNTYSANTLINSTKQKNTVSIVIPVYKDIESLKKCISSVFESKTKIDYKIILVNDASPETEVCHYLNQLKNNTHVILINNPLNLGFVKSANKGLFYREFGDCVLLNSDTEVNHFWLDRLYNAAYSAPNIGTVTPLSNNSELTSFPIPNHNNPLPTNHKWQKVDEIASKINQNGYIEIPSGVGFCFYIKRQCLDECGGLNETDILLGYGDEAEFCLRIAERGWKNICATDLFVFHEGGKSFNHEKRKLALENMKSLEVLYPNYKKNYLRFLRQDPLHEYRYQIEKECIEVYARCSKLLLLGFDQLIPEEEIFRALKQNRSIYWLRPEYQRDRLVYRLVRDRDSIPANLVYQLPQEKKRLVNDLLNLNIPHMEFWETLHYIHLLNDLPELLNCSYSIYPNDYSLLCPQVYLIDKNNHICTGPTKSKCKVCIGKEGPLSGHFVNDDVDKFEELKETKINVLSDSSNIIHIEPFINHAVEVRVDSEFSQDVFKSAFSKAKVKKNRIPNSLLKRRRIHKVKTSERSSISSSIKVAVPHHLSIYSGYTILMELAHYARLENIDIEFLVFGNTINDAELQKTGKVFVNKPLTQEEYQYLPTRYNCNKALFLFRWPIPMQTEINYCLNEGMEIAGFNVGIFNELFDSKQGFLLFSPDATIAEICMSLNNWRNSGP